jgi:hypothetical protein
MNIYHVDGAPVIELGATALRDGLSIEQIDRERARIISAKAAPSR